MELQTPLCLNIKLIDNCLDELNNRSEYLSDFDLDYDFKQFIRIFIDNCLDEHKQLIININNYNENYLLNKFKRFLLYRNISVENIKNENIYDFITRMITILQCDKELFNVINTNNFIPLSNTLCDLDQLDQVVVICKQNNNMFDVYELYDFIEITDLYDLSSNLNNDIILLCDITIYQIKLNIINKFKNYIIQNDDDLSIKYFIIFCNENRLSFNINLFNLFVQKNLQYLQIFIPDNMLDNNQILPLDFYKAYILNYI